MYNRVYGKEGALVTKPQIVGWGWVVGVEGGHSLFRYLLVCNTK